ncbi:hypothetical protein JW933_06465 [candidate division FCPU426 bacterium]|nr:hypothetical protein [candidate division FCPU426 bacterium]
MPAIIRSRRTAPNRPAAIRRKMKGAEREIRAQESQLQSQVVQQQDAVSLPAAATETARELQPQENHPATPGEKTDTPRIAVKRIRDGVTVEQTVQYLPAKGKPAVFATVRLTTSMRGKRKTDGLAEAAYLLRLEVMAASEAVRLEGLRLGPWQLHDLSLETHGLLVTEPLWTGFQPLYGPIKGRLILGDTLRNRLLDLPFHTEATIPGPEPFGP